ncbi:MAG: hypothetical protein ACOZAM_21910 [Pseudomonadota bacterium]
MRDYREKMGRSLKELRRETRWQALFISMPATGLALFYLLMAAGFYVKPLVLLRLAEPSVWGPMQVSPAVETSLTIGVPMAGAAWGVYFLAMRVLWRVKVGEPRSHGKRSFSA